MKEEINFSIFCDRFKDMNRDNNFTYEGKRALFDYLESYEEDTDTKIELDVIALCCEYNEYKNLKEYLNDYSADVDREDYEDEEEYLKDVEKYISENTTLIKFGDDLEEGFIIQAY